MSIRWIRPFRSAGPGSTQVRYRSTSSSGTDSSNGKANEGRARLRAHSRANERGRRHAFDLHGGAWPPRVVRSSDASNIHLMQLDSRVLASVEGGNSLEIRHEWFDQSRTFSRGDVSGVECKR